MTELKTDSKLLEALKKAAGRQMSQDEFRKQRVSFVWGSMSSKNPIKKSEISKIIDAQLGIRKSK